MKTAIVQVENLLLIRWPASGCGHNLFVKGCKQHQRFVSISSVDSRKYLRAKVGSNVWAKIMVIANHKSSESHQNVVCYPVVECKFSASLLCICKANEVQAATLKTCEMLDKQAILSLLCSAFGSFLKLASNRHGGSSLLNILFILFPLKDVHYQTPHF